MDKGLAVDHAGRTGCRHRHTRRAEDADNFNLLQSGSEGFGKAAQLAIGQPRAVICHGAKALMRRDGAHQFGGNGAV